MNSYKKLGRAESAVSGGQLGPSGACAGDDLSTRQQSPIRHPQPLSAAGAGGPAVPFPRSVPAGASQPKGKCPGKAKLMSGAGVVPKKWRSAKRGSVPELTVPTPDPYTGPLQPEGLPLHGAACPVPTGTVVETSVPGDGLLYGQPDRATPVFVSALGALSAGQGPVSVGQSAQGSSGLAYYEGHALILRVHQLFRHPRVPGIVWIFFSDNPGLCAQKPSYAWSRGTWYGSWVSLLRQNPLRRSARHSRGSRARLRGPPKFCLQCPWIALASTASPILWGLANGVLSLHGWTNIIVFLLRISIIILRLRQCLTRRRINSPRTGGALHPSFHSRIRPAVDWKKS